MGVDFMNFVYIVKCKDNTLYTGYTTDLDRRVTEHNKGIGAKYTKGRLPVRLVYFEKHDSKSEAMSREYKIKSLSRSKKLKLIHQLNKQEEV